VNNWTEDKMATYDRCEFEPIEFTTTCKYCGKTNLEWIKYNNKWCLIDTDGNLHLCKRNNLWKKTYQKFSINK
jgi:hypothetical protein